MTGRPGASRYLFIDMLRGLAVVVMIETHTVNALLLPRMEGGMFRSALMFVNGLVAPAFLFCAGLGFAVSLARRAGEGPPGRDMLLATVKKCLFIMLVGYSMHVPVFSLGGLLSLPPLLRDGFFQVDILQVIGVSLLILLGVGAVFRTGRSRIAAAGVLAAVTMAAGTLEGTTGIFGGWGEGLPAGLRAYFSRDLSPLFTIVPWSACLFTGFLAGTLFLRGAGRGSGAEVIRRIAGVSAASLAGAVVLGTFTASWYRGGGFWYWSAEYLVIRLASVSLGMCALWYLSRRGAGPAGETLALFGRESLPVYYYHVIIVYGKDVDWSFVRLFPGGLGYGECLAAVAGLTGAMYLFALAWNSAKRHRPGAARAAVRLLVAGSTAVFLLS